MVPVELRKARDGTHHRRFMMLVSFVVDHHPAFDGMHPSAATTLLLDKLKMATGHYRHHILDTGEIIYQPLSISFDAMDEGEFAVWSAKAREVIHAKYLAEFTPWDKVRLAREIDSWLAWV